MSRFEPWSEERTVEIVAAHAGREGPLMPILHAVQEAFGHVPEEAVPVIAREVNLSRAEVHGVVTFYHDLKRVPADRPVIKLCRAEACQARGVDALVPVFEAADKWIRVETVYCLGLCASGPAVMIGDSVYARLDEAGAKLLIGKFAQ
jgi:formate dehydrogenase subunit gamma